MNNKLKLVVALLPLCVYSTEGFAGGTLTNFYLTNNSNPVLTLVYNDSTDSEKKGQTGPCYSEPDTRTIYYGQTMKNYVYTGTHAFPSGCRWAHIGYQINDVYGNNIGYLSVDMSRPEQENNWTYSITKKYNNNTEYRTNFGRDVESGNFQ